MPDAKLEFYFRKGLVGIFQVSEFPSEPGVYPYMPYRSGAHHGMHLTLRESGFAECSLVTENGSVRFKVIGCPEYGQLQLSDFKPVWAVDLQSVVGNSGDR